jgi:predicted transcriptional regulator
VIIQSICIETKVEAGKINTSVRDLIREYIRSVPKDLTLKISLEVLRKKRSEPQNRYYWGVIVPLCMQGILEARGEMHSKDAMHLYLKKEVGRMITIVNGKEVVDTVTRLNTAQAEIYHEACRAHAAIEWGVMIPLPNENLTLTIYN